MSAATAMETDVANTTSEWRDHVIMWTKDASRAVDYAETRPDLDHNKLAYYGYSWGAAMGGIVPAVEPRIKVCVLVLGGLDFHRSLPEVDTINFVSRVKQPDLDAEWTLRFLLSRGIDPRPVLQVTRIEEGPEEASALRYRPQYPAQRTYQADPGLAGPVSRAGELGSAECRLLFPDLMPSPE